MPSTGESRLTWRIGPVVVVLAIIGGGLWWWQHRRDGEVPAISAVTRPQNGSERAAAPQRAASAQLARLTISVTDDKGPLPGATVRLASRADGIVLVTTGTDGVAHADHLEPGVWTATASAADHVPAALQAKQLAAGDDERLAIKLTVGGRVLSGTISDATGGPVAGARIDAARLSREAAPGEAVSTTLSGTDGKYRMTVAEGQLLVAAVSADYAPQSRYVEVGPTGATADFSLVPGGVLEGVVRDERTKEVVPGASVVARRDSPAMMLAETSSRRATSGSDGRFRIGGLPPGAWEVGASDHARYSRSPTIVGLGVAEQVTDVELLIGSGPVIRGHVVDDSGVAAPRVQIRAFTRGGGSATVADTAGSFVLEGLRPGEYDVTASGETYLQSAEARISLTDKDVDNIELMVKRGRTLKGHVEPRQICDVQQEPDDRAAMMMPPASSATTGADGAFSLGPLGDGATILSARCASGDQGSTRVTVARDMPEAIIKVAPGGSIAGRVVDGDRKAAAGVSVTASDLSSGERAMAVSELVTSGVQALTDSTGAYRLEGMSPGRYRIGVLDRGKPLRLRAPPPTVELAANEHKSGVDLSVDRPKGIISGTVTGPDGKPLTEAWVSAQQNMISMLDTMRGDADRQGRSESRTMVVENHDGPGVPDTSVAPALTDAQGHYEIRGLPRATYTVVAEAQHGQLRGRALGIEPDATVDLRALGVTSLSGTVTGSAGPCALFSVELDGPTRAQRSFTDGKFSFGRVDPGTYAVRVESADGNGAGTIEVKPNEAAALDITLTSNAIVIGKLVRPDGSPIAGQLVTLIADSGDGKMQFQIEGAPPTTAPNGSFRLERRAGKAILVVIRPSGPFTRRGLVLEAGKTLDIGTVIVAPPATGSGT